MGSDLLIDISMPPIIYVLYFTSFSYPKFHITCYSLTLQQKGGQVLQQKGQKRGQVLKNKF